MLDLISRKVLALAIISTLPQLILVYTFVDVPWVRWSSLAAALAGISLAGLFARSLAWRIKSLTGFVNRLPELTGKPSKLRARATLPAGDDELGELVHSLSGIAPQIEETVNRLRAELARREAILPSMAEAGLAGDARLNVMFCNDAFLHALGGQVAVEGLPLVKLIRDPGLIQAAKQAFDS